MRVQRILAAAGLGSRRKAEEWIRAGRVSVNGQVARLGDRAEPERDDVRLDGKRVHAQALQYWLLHKPPDVLTTRSDPHASRSGRATVMDLVPAEVRAAGVFPVGRLDANSEGLLLLTNDGHAAQALLHPSLGTEKEYRVTVRGIVSEATRRELSAGPMLEDGPMAACKVGGLQKQSGADATQLTLTLLEGRKRQIRRALRSLGHPVLRLVRVRMGPLHLGRLACGEARPLAEPEVAALLRHTHERSPRAAGSGSRRSATGKSGSGPL